MKQICMKSPVSDSVLRTLRFSFSRLQKKRKWLSYVLAQLCFLLERKYFALWRNVLCEWRIQTSQDDCLAQMQGASHIPHLCWATTGWNKDFNFWNPQWREKGACAVLKKMGWTRWNKNAWTFHVYVSFGGNVFQGGPLPSGSQSNISDFQSNYAGSKKSVFVWIAAAQEHWQPPQQWFHMWSQTWPLKGVFWR